MSDFDEAVARERLRLQGLIADAEGKIGELNSEVALYKQTVEALDAYDRIKSGKPAGKATGKRAARREATPAARPAVSSAPEDS